MLFGVFLEELAECPFDGEEMNTKRGFADFDGSYDIWMCDPRAVRRFSKKACNCGFVRSKLFLQNLDGSDAMGGVFGSVNHCRSTLTNHILQ